MDNTQNYSSAPELSGEQPKTTLDVSKEPVKMDKDELVNMKKLSVLEDKLFRRAKIGTNIIRRLTLVKRINHYRAKLNMKQVGLADF